MYMTSSLQSAVFRCSKENITLLRFFLTHIFQSNRLPLKGFVLDILDSKAIQSPHLVLLLRKFVVSTVCKASLNTSKATCEVGCDSK